MILLGLVVAVLGSSVASRPGERVIVPECAVEATGVDSDADGLTDGCELALASVFAPLFLVRTGGCNWVEDAAPARLGGGYLHAVGPVTDRVRIVYLPAYFVDCRWQDARCVLPFVTCAPHSGDSEMIVVEVQRDTPASAWSVTGVFLSAHCFGRGSRSCRWYRDEDLSQFEWYGPAPVVWVAEGRNANYPSWQSCNAGHRTMDTCARHDASYRFPVRPAGNVGSRKLPAWSDGCLAGDPVGQGAVDPERIECFWDPVVLFRGWQAAGRGVTPYERYLREIAGF
jgi:hypothetical protein